MQILIPYPWESCTKSDVEEYNTYDGEEPIKKFVSVKQEVMKKFKLFDTESFNISVF